MKYADMSSKELLDLLNDVDKRGKRSTTRSRQTNSRRTRSPMSLCSAAKTARSTTKRPGDAGES